LKRRQLETTTGADASRQHNLTLYPTSSSSRLRPVRPTMPRRQLQHSQRRLGAQPLQLTMPRRDRVAHPRKRSRERRRSPGT
jgi:hypothetical protein